MNIGVLNSGGDSPGLNAVIEGVVGAASRRGWNVVGFYDGFEGLLSEEGDERFEWLTPAACRGLRAKGGTILGTVNKGNFAIKVGVDQKGAIEPAVLEKRRLLSAGWDWMPRSLWAETAPSPRLFCFPR